MGRRYAGPAFELSELPSDAYTVLAADFVTTEDGTGLVHIAPAFGEEDFELAELRGPL